MKSLEDVGWVERGELCEKSKRRSQQPASISARVLGWGVRDMVVGPPMWDKTSDSRSSYKETRLVSHRRCHHPIPYMSFKPSDGYPGRWYEEGAKDMTSTNRSFLRPTLLLSLSSRSSRLFYTFSEVAFVSSEKHLSLKKLLLLLRGYGGTGEFTRAR